MTLLRTVIVELLIKVVRENGRTQVFKLVEISPGISAFARYCLWCQLGVGRHTPLPVSLYRRFDMLKVCHYNLGVANTRCTSLFIAEFMPVDFIMHSVVIDVFCLHMPVGASRATSDQ